MSFRRAIKRMIERLGYRVSLERIDPTAPPEYCADGIRTRHNHRFVQNEAYQAALRRAAQADPTLAYMRWRLHVALWAASHAVQLEGDFVECGVNRGFLSSGIMQYLDWNRRGRRFFLFDTFQGIDESQLSPSEIELGRIEHSRGFSECHDHAVSNFAEFDGVHIVRGIVPQSLSTVDIDRVAYLSIDMNCAAADAAAVRHFWPRLSPGGVLLIDDYAYQGYEPTYEVLSQVIRDLGAQVLSLPTGQGLVLKTQECVHP